MLATATGRKHKPSNLRRELLRPALDVANERLTKKGIAAIEPVTFHSPCGTDASLRCAVGDDVRYMRHRSATRIRA